jgi:hypothetical protein
MISGDPRKGGIARRLHPSSGLRYRCWIYRYSRDN